ncbi:hypothetical protein OS190_20000 [Sulfitobacter sp. F26204]|uniref:hypothetical protein n=1 Tax=Sulfitobacter sp. F26204 TaxID=2996014 RepID=UPI00225E20DC|nr:hypothetical protein [Sulfitobacter sp. F26204]MCX7561851.1 hypothetical protein [Sulfitobacter sp. F26204]
MATILTFRNKESGSSAKDFLTDETEKLSFRTADDGAVSLEDMAPASLPNIIPDPKRDWSNQELADLFRVKQLLSGANVPVETMRGVTDEGDPWFIFCHFNGDVFIHMARIDGLYILDSPNVRRPLRGRDFNALIADYTNHALPTMQNSQEGGTEHRIIRFERGSKVRLHPSAMLAALIWTLFLASEELVMLAPEEQTGDTDDLLDFSAVISADYEFHTVETETAALTAISMPEAMKEIDTDALHGTPEAQVQIREVMGQQGLAMHQNTFAMGLSTIAIAMGFMSEAVLLDNQRKVLEGLKNIGLTQDITNTVTGPELEQIAGDSALLDMLAEFVDLDLSLNTETIETISTTGEASVLQQEMLHVTAAAAESDAPLAPVKTVQTVIRENTDAELSETLQDGVQTTTDMERLIALAAAEQNKAITVNMSDLVNKNVQMEEFQLGQTTVKASFDLTDSDALSLTDYIFVSHRTTSHREFDDRAQSFIDYIQSKDTEVGIITIGNEVIMIDRQAFTESAANTYSFSWETYDGHVISLIGLRAEFQEFDLIA